MYHYQLVTVKETHSVIDREKCTPVVYIGHRENEEDEEIISQCITLTEKVIQTMGSDYYVPSHLLIQTKKQILSGDSFYIALPTTEENHSFLISPDTFFETTKSNLESKMKEIEQELFKEEYFFSNKSFFRSSIFYEVFDEEKTFYTDELFNLFNDILLIEENYIRHKEPLTFSMGETFILLLTSKDIEESRLRILEVVGPGILKEVLHLPFDLLLIEMKKRNYTLQHFIDARKALKSIKAVQETSRYF